MKKTILLLACALASISFCCAQQVETHKVPRGYKFTQNGLPLTINELALVVEPNPEAFAMINQAKSNRSSVLFLNYTGGFLIGLQIVKLLSPALTIYGVRGRKANWKLAGLGAGLIAISVPISAGVKRKTKHAVDLYNSSFPTSTSLQEYQPKWRLIANGNGIGLELVF